MTFKSKPEDGLDPAARIANSWVRKIADGQMTAEDADALRSWCAERPEHGAAFASAKRLWDDLGGAAQLSAARAPVALADFRAGDAAKRARRQPPPDWRRRAFFGAAAAAGVAAVGTAVVMPPLGLWPSLGELRADYRTGTGERRAIELAGDVKVEMNTRTSIAMRPASEGVGMDLVDGQAVVDATSASAPFVVTASSGTIVARGSRFDVRYTADEVCVTCLSGELRISHAAGALDLRQAQQLRYGRRQIGALVTLAPDDMPAWRDGFLRFRQTQLAAVIEEINRYRPGRVVLLADSAAAKPVSARFRIDDLDTAITQIREGFGLKATPLPGGVVLLT